ncbi:hypothetical protein [Catenuloplanes atrovinosus]|nr:hypothetical protein [Catenuloplanes atrovinosus]
MNRARDLLTAWDRAVAAHHDTAPSSTSAEELDQLRAQLGRKTRECAALQQRLAAAATTIAALHHDNIALRDELAQHHSSIVIPLAARP